MAHTADNMTMVCDDSQHAECRATLRYQDPADYKEPDYPIFLCKCPCHGGLFGAVVDNSPREASR